MTAPVFLAILFAVLFAAAMLWNTGLDASWASALGERDDAILERDGLRMDRDYAHLDTEIARMEADYLAEVNHTICDKLQLAHDEIRALKAVIADLDNRARGSRETMKAARVDMIRRAYVSRREDDQAEAMRNKIVEDIERGKGG